jgi:tellurite resistance protein TerC
MNPLLLPLLFAALIGGGLAADLGLLRRGAQAERTARQAMGWTALWVTAALCFGAVVYGAKGGDAAFAYLTAYLVEWSLSIDNVFAFAMVFTLFAIPSRLQHRPLAIGIAAALVLRAAIIAAGVGLIARFEWLLPCFGALLLLTAYRMLRAELADGDSAAHGHPLLERLRRALPVSASLHGSRLAVREGGRRLLTPLGLAVVAIVGLDLVFAVDSIPAVIAISPDAFVIATSNAFALMGLRSLYVLLAGARERFALIGVGLSAALAFIGAKLVVSALLGVELPTAASLAVVVGCLGGSIGASLLRARR